MDTRFTSHLLCPPPYAYATLYHTSKYQATVVICFGLVRSHQHDKADDKQERGLINLPRFLFFVRNCSHPYAANDCRDKFFFLKALRHKCGNCGWEEQTVLPRHAYGEVDPVTSDLCAT